MINSTASTIEINRKKRKRSQPEFLWSWHNNQTLPKFRKVISGNWSMIKIGIKKRLKLKLKFQRCDMRHNCRKQQSNQKTEADIK